MNEKNESPTGRIRFTSGSPAWIPADSIARVRFNEKKP